MGIITMIIAGSIYAFGKGGGPKMVSDWWDGLTAKKKAEITSTIAVIEKDIEKAQIISRIKKSGDGYEIIQNSIGF